MTEETPINIDNNGGLRSLKQISRGQPRNKGHNNQTILIGGFEN